MRRRRRNEGLAFEPTERRSLLRVHMVSATVYAFCQQTDQYQTCWAGSPLRIKVELGSRPKSWPKGRITSSAAERERRQQSIPASLPMWCRRVVSHFIGVDFANCLAGNLGCGEHISRYRLSLPFVWRFPAARALRKELARVISCGVLACRGEQMIAKK